MHRGQFSIHYRRYQNVDLFYPTNMKSSQEKQEEKKNEEMSVKIKKIKLKTYLILIYPVFRTDVVAIGTDVANVGIMRCATSSSSSGTIGTTARI